MLRAGLLPSRCLSSFIYDFAFFALARTSMKVVHKNFKHLKNYARAVSL